MVEPSGSSFLRNLLTKDDCRSALRDEIVEDGPQVSLVVESFSFACGTERLTGAASCPHGEVVGPSCLSEGVAPDSDSGEEMTLSKSSKVIWVNFSNTAFINFSLGYEAALDKFAQPRRRILVIFIVIYSHVSS